MGGGAVAARKVRLLLSAGACVRVVAPEAGTAIRRLAKAGKLKLARRPFRAGDLDGVTLAVAAAGDAALNAVIVRASRRRGVPLNVVDEPDKCDFIVPAVVESGGLLIAVSTSGASPGLAARIATRLRGEYGREYGRILRHLERLRCELKRRVPEQRRRKEIIDRVLDGEAMKLMLKGRWEEAKREIEKLAGG